MGIKDIIFMALIIGGALYLLYRSVWKKKGHCSGCGPDTCEMKKTKEGGC
ncbi:MAG: FeoB-associated Cys-rich membrane protein [Nitrospirae bacterium]|nr:FeoB-associated Cys-rich membrane protein [Nitrospirota bacterium]